MLAGAACPRSTACSLQRGTPTQEFRDPTKATSALAAPSTGHDGKLPLKYKLCLLCAMFSRGSSCQGCDSQEQPGCSGCSRGCPQQWDSARSSINSVAVGCNAFCSHQLNHLFVAAPTTKPGRFKPMIPSRDSIAATFHMPFIPSNSFTPFVLSQHFINCS